jgi:hypothetical protein
VSFVAIVPPRLPKLGTIRSLRFRCLIRHSSLTLIVFSTQRIEVDVVWRAGYDTKILPALFSQDTRN